MSVKQDFVFLVINSGWVRLKVFRDEKREEKHYQMCQGISHNNNGSKHGRKRASDIHMKKIKQINKMSKVLLCFTFN